jgi:riboflavin synthase
MFTGIVETTSQIIEIAPIGSNLIFTLSNPFKDDIYIDQSISHNGVCLTVIHFDKHCYKVEAIQETLNKSNLGGLVVGDHVNLERSLLPSARIDGHFVQGHVDTKGEITKIVDRNGSWEMAIAYPEAFDLYLIPKGSICMNGVSLTIAALSNNQFTVAIIPYTYEHTNLKYLTMGSMVNLEFDSMGKYVVNYLKKTNS